MISSLSLRNYRSYDSFDISFNEKHTTIIGKNGIGKTNILEAVQVICEGKSFRASDQYLIKNGTQKAKIIGFINNNKRSVTLEKNGDKIKKTIMVKNKNYSRISQKNNFPTVLFEPEFFQIITRSPEIRREYIDTILCKIIPNYYSQLNKYKRAVAQRNSLLKTHPTKDKLFVWDVKISELGGYIAHCRQDLITQINKKISDIYSSIANSNNDISIEYISTAKIDNYSESLLILLERNVDNDINRGFTTHGPHRDDIKLFLNKKEVSLSASRGETRTLLLALKIIECNIIEYIQEYKPILLLDDVFSELDETRQQKLVLFLKDYQSIITTTHINKHINATIVKI